MRKMFLILVAVLFQCAFAQSFDFNTNGINEANIILKEFIQTKFDSDNINTIGFFYNDNVIGIVKHNVFYSLEGYKLIFLKKNGINYEPVESDVFFDNTREFIIDNNKITFYKTPFYKNKKYSATIKNDKIKTRKSLFDKLTDRKVKSIGKLTQYSECNDFSFYNLSDFKTNPEPTVNIKYNNLNPKTKHYLEMR